MTEIQISNTKNRRVGCEAETLKFVTSPDFIPLTKTYHRSGMP